MDNWARNLAVEIVDACHGYTVEHSPWPDSTRIEYDVAEQQIRNAISWKPIETAPKNGPDFLARDAKGDICRCWRQAPSRNVDRILTFRQKPFAAVSWIPLDALPIEAKPD